jgi:hypothetical protein
MKGACACKACDFLRRHGREIESGLEIALEEGMLVEEEREEAALTNAAFSALLGEIEASAPPAVAMNGTVPTGCQCLAEEGDCRLKPHGHRACGKTPARWVMQPGWPDALYLCKGCEPATDLVVLEPTPVSPRYRRPATWPPPLEQSDPSARRIAWVLWIFAAIVIAGIVVYGCNQ